MASFVDVFERREVKYRLDAHRCLAMRRALAEHMELDAYGLSRISSVYFDTPNRAVIAHSVSKPAYKEKLRVRWYGSLRSGGRVFIELKKKAQGVVYKRRVSCSREAAAAYMMHGMPYEAACAAYPLADGQMQAEALSPRSVQIAREIDCMVERWGGLVPSMLIACDRLAYAPVPEHGPDTPDALRVTFDARLGYADLMASGRSVDDALAGTLADSCAFNNLFCDDAELTPLIDASEALMEIKVPGALPLWVSHALDACEARPISFSKYGAAYKQCCCAQDGTAHGQVSTATVQIPASASPRHMAARPVRGQHRARFAASRPTSEQGAARPASYRPEHAALVQ